MESSKIAHQNGTTKQQKNPTFQQVGNLQNQVSENVRQIPLSEIKPSPENDLLYRPYDPGERQNQKLTANIKTDGVENPLVLTLDYFIISGHRRFHSARRAGLKSVPCLFKSIRRSEYSQDEYIALLRSHNLNRVKTITEQMREAIVDTDKTTAMEALIEARKEKALEGMGADFVEIEGEVNRSQISDVKEEMVTAILKAVEERWEFCPLSVRSIHYALLNSPPLRNCGSNPKFRKPYANDRNSYGDLCDLCARLRLAGRLSWNAINDETRPFDFSTFDNSPASFFERQLYWFLKNYRRNLLQTQSHHIASH